MNRTNRTARPVATTSRIWNDLTAAQSLDRQLVASLLTRTEIERLLQYAVCRDDRADAMDLRFHL